MSQQVSRFHIPPGACDCHVHIFAPEQFPYSPKRGYTPGPASVEELESFERRIGVERCVLVQPSPYGTDNSCLIEGLRRLGGRARGVAVIDPERTSDAELDALGRVGVRSVRVNLEAHGNRDPQAAERALKAVSKRVADRAWSIQVYASLPVVAELKDTVVQLPVQFVADHFAGARGAEGISQAGLSTLLEMLKSGNVYVKLSAPYRASSLTTGYEDLAPIARALIAAAPDRMVWASDWPHTGGGATGSNDRKGRSLEDVEPYRLIDVPHVLDVLSSWVKNEDIWKRILVDNPARLYGFS